MYFFITTGTTSHVTIEKRHIEKNHYMRRLTKILTSSHVTIEMVYKEEFFFASTHEMIEKRYMRRSLCRIFLHKKTCVGKSYTEKIIT